MSLMIVVEGYQGRAVTDHPVEIVERKGTGHPDFICDAVMDAISVALCRAYLEEFGTILHHNIDKSLLAAGRAELEFGGGRLVQPMELIIGDRATNEVEGKVVPVGDIALAAARQWLGKNLRHVDPDWHLRYRLVLAPGSAELTDIFARPGRVRGANDTSAAVGYFPLSPTETAVLELERHLNSAAFKERFPESCEDVKIMGLRRGRHLDLTVAMPLLSRLVGSEREYFERKEVLLLEMEKFLERYQAFERYDIQFNSLDERGRGLGGAYLSLLGTSAEGADSGQVGRGNRVNGLIALNRPLGTEAAAGKNPVSHVGKIYNVLAHQAARRICERVAGLREVYVFLQSRIGQPIDRPVIANAQLVLEPGCSLEEVRPRAREILHEAIEGVGGLCDQLARGRFPIC